MKNGYVKLWRRIQRSLAWQDDALLKAWAACLILANHEPADIPVGNQTVHLEPGQFVTGQYSLHSFCYPRQRSQNPSSHTLWRRLLILENGKQIEIKTSNKFSIVTVINWHLYQGKPEENGKQDGKQDGKQMENRWKTDGNEQEVKEEQEAKEEVKRPSSELGETNISDLPETPPLSLALELALESENPDQATPESVVALYHEILASKGRPKIRLLGKKLRGHLKARIGTDRQTHLLSWWRAFFDNIALSDFHMGRTGQWQGMDLHWILGPQNFEKMVNRDFAKEARQDGGVSDEEADRIWAEARKKANGE